MNKSCNTQFKAPCPTCYLRNKCYDSSNQCIDQTFNAPTTEADLNYTAALNRRQSLINQDLLDIAINDSLGG